MGMVLVNGYLAFKYLSPHLMTLQEFPIVIAQVMRVDKEAEADLPKGVCTQSVQQGETSGRAVGAPAEHISHACVRGKSLGLGRVKGEGVCSICKYNHAAGICVTCSKDLSSSHSGCVMLENMGNNATVNICTQCSDAANEQTDLLEQSGIQHRSLQVCNKLAE